MKYCEDTFKRRTLREYDEVIADSDTNSRGSYEGKNTAGVIKNNEHVIIGIKKISLQKKEKKDQNKTY